MPDSERGRPESVTAAELAEYLKFEEVPCTVRDFANVFDVTPKTIRKRTDELTKFAGVSSKQAGNSKIYWYSSMDEYGDKADASLNILDEIETPELSETVRDFKRGAYEDVVKARAIWLDGEEVFKENRPDCEQSLESNLNLRASAWNGFEQYVSETRLYLPNAFSEAMDPDDERSSYVKGEVDLSGWEMGVEEFDYYANHIKLGGSGVIEQVRGLAAYNVKMIDLNNKVQSEYESSGPNPDLEILDETFPHFEDILYAGSVYDDFISGLWGFDW